jgi:predicted acylesterase/phospholipase RssA
MVSDTRGSFERVSGEVLPRVAAAADGGPINVLALSGGGAGGAFGAGVLVGWSEQGTRPEFQIVTGVSAGALIAPFAFLGPSWDGRLAEAFSGARGEHLLQRRWLGMLFGPSLYRGEPLANLVDSYVTDELLRAVAIEAARGRLLLVATTNLDNEQTNVWNLTLIASQGGEAARRLFRDVLIAAASIPGAFPPVIIRVEESGKSFDELHVDGATTASVFIAPQIAGFLDPLTALRGANLYVIFNTALAAEPQTTPIGTLAIIKRGIDAELRSGKLADLQFATDFAQRNEMNINVTDIPGDYPFDPLDVRKAAMRFMFDFAARCTAEGHIWATPLALMEESQQVHFARSQASTRCPAPESKWPARAIQTLNVADPKGSAADGDTSAP